MSMKYVIVVATLVTLFALATVPGHAHQPTHTPTIAQTERPADDLDPTFGTNGQVISDLAAGTDAVDAVLLPDDRILVLGTLFYPEGSTDGEGSDFMLMRFTSDGMPDPTFGDNGMVTASAALSDTARAMIVQPDNNILVTGQDSENITLMRFTPDGTLDATFGEEGIAQIPSDPLITLDRVELQPDGKIVLAGGVDVLEPQRATFILIRFNADGSLDLNFGDNGRVITEEGDRIQDLVIQPDGKILVAGNDSELGSPQANIIIARYNPDGSKDTAFGEEGVLTTTTNHLAEQILLLENSDFLAVMNTPPELSSIGRAFDIALTKYRADGSVDPNFRSNEESSIDAGQNEEASVITLSSTGQILLAGTTNVISGAVDFDIFLVRYAPDGSIEGAITTDLGKEEFSRQVLVQSDGKFVVVGTTQDDAVRDLGESDFFLLRYLNSPFNQVYLPLTIR